MPTEHFSIHASVVFQLGETLITDEIQALVELVKNCYDADATKVRLQVDTNGSIPAGSSYPQAKGYIIVEDDGVGMTMDAIRRGWLTISNSVKREIKRKGHLPINKRTPLGDKGLGRLGAQRLGRNIEIWTRPQKGGVEYHVSFSWSDFNDKELLQEVPVAVEENHNPTRKSGTRILISDLVAPAFWEGKDATKNLQAELAQMISPYGEVQNFKLSVNVNGEAIDLVSLAQQVRKTAELRYNITFDGERLHATGKAHLEYFRPANKPELNWYDLAEADKGDRLYNFLITRSNLKDYGLKRCQETGWFIEFSYDQVFEDIPNLERIGKSTPNPGAFSGEVDSFDLGINASQQQTVLNTSAEYRQIVKNLSGIRVYRDGFGIRVAKDWLGLSKQQTSGGSYYGLRPENVMGYIALTARDNATLEETTNRQDFVENAYYRNFYKILSQWVKFTERVQDALRSTWNEYVKVSLVPDAADNTPEGLVETLSKNLKHARAATKPLASLRTAMKNAVDNARHTVYSAQVNSTLYALDASDRQKLETSVQAFESKALEVDQITRRLDEVVISLEAMERQSYVVRDQVGELRQRIAETYETVSLGITAEALTHEIYNITDRLADQTRWVRAELKKRNIVIAEVVTYLERVSNSVSALRKQLTHLDPSLKYLRDKRENVNLFDFMQEQTSFFEDRFARQNIRVEVEEATSKQFIVHMSKGKLVQIMDNILLNSEYWLREDIRSGRLKEGVITVRLDLPLLQVFDNGSGIASQVENSVFEPFVSMKDHGRGLGLFIIRQLLETEGGHVHLQPTRNVNGRLYIFSIDLSATLSDKVENDA